MNERTYDTNTNTYDHELLRAGAAVVAIYDVHGLGPGRPKSVCDALSTAGVHVIMPDFYHANANGGVSRGS